SNTSMDYEGITYNPTHNSFYVSDERGPHIREFSRTTGNLMLDITPSTNSQLAVYSGTRTNNGWESMGRQPDGQTSWTINQEALTSDGNTSTISVGGLLRAQKFDANM